MPRGCCALCHQDAELQRSHLIPKSLYEELRDGTSGDYIVLSTDTVRHSGIQICDYLLCAQCEALFNENCERWIKDATRMGSDGRSLIQFAIEQAFPSHGSDPFHIVAGREIDFVDIEALAYFAASVVWRGSVHDWRGINSGCLGDRYNEEFRQYLLGLREFPVNAVVIVWVARSTHLRQAIFFPSAAKHRGIHHYQFLVPGLLFDVLVGKQIPAEFRKMCALRSPKGTLIVCHDFKDAVINRFSRMAATARPSKRIRREYATRTGRNLASRQRANGHEYPGR